MIIYLLWNIKVYYSVHKSRLLLVHILSQMKPGNTLLPEFLKIRCPQIYTQVFQVASFTFSKMMLPLLEHPNLFIKVSSYDG
jgi:hypothetical protein